MHMITLPVKSFCSIGQKKMKLMKIISPYLGITYVVTSVSGLKCLRFECDFCSPVINLSVDVVYKQAHCQVETTKKELSRIMAENPGAASAAGDRFMTQLHEQVSCFYNTTFYLTQSLLIFVVAVLGGQAWLPPHPRRLLEK